MLTFSSVTPAQENPFQPKTPPHAVSNEAPTKVAIIENNRLKAGLLASLCSSACGLTVVATERTALEGIASLARTGAALVLAGLMPLEIEPQSLLRDIHRISPAAKILLLTPQCTEYIVHTTGSTGYHGFLYEAEEDPISLASSISRVLRGERVISPAILQVQQGLRSAPLAFPKLLTAREEEVLLCIAHSMSDDEIAGQMGLSAGTALSHRRRIMHKLSIHSTPKLIQYCAQKGFNTVPPFPRKHQITPRHEYLSSPKIPTPEGLSVQLGLRPVNSPDRSAGITVAAT